MKLQYHLLFFVWIFASCVKDKPVPAGPVKLSLSSSKKVYVVNEGNFGSGNASVSLYDPATGQVVENIYQTVNGTGLGDVAQSLAFVNEKFYLLVNNSSKILVCDAGFKKLAQVNGLASPRYMQPVSNNKAYVSDLYANAIHVIDLSLNTRVKTIACPGWTERMVMLYNKVLVTNPKRSYAYFINTITDAIEDSVFVGTNAYGVVLDNHDKAWVLASGDSVKAQLPRLSAVNLLSGKVDMYLDFKSEDKPGNLCLSAGKDSLYFLNRGIYKMSVGATTLPVSALIPASGRNYYGLGITPANFRIYASDALDYSQKSNVYIFDANGKELSFFKSGINTNGFYFE